MDGVVNSIFRFLLPSKISLKTEKLVKNIALAVTHAPQEQTAPFHSANF